MKKGFTVVELLIVVAIILIIAAIAVPNIIRKGKENTPQTIYEYDQNQPIQDNVPEQPLQNQSKEILSKIRILETDECFLYFGEGEFVLISLREYQDYEIGDYYKE